MKNLLTFFQENDKFARHSGIELLEISEGCAKAVMKIGKHHLNAVGSVHGGAIFTLADFVFAVASNSHGTVSVAINASISFLKAAGKGSLFAEAKEIARNPKLASYTVNVTDEQENLIAIFQGMVYRKKENVMAAS